MSQIKFPSFHSSINMRVSGLISLPPQKYYGNTHLASPTWVKLELGNQSVEGILHGANQSELSKVIIFEPGFPGGGSTKLEKLHVNKLLASGFSVFAARHNATIINGKHSHNYINCVEKQEEAKAAGQELLGTDREASIADWLVEPLISISFLADIFQEIYLIGHSFGALAILNSLVKLRQADSKGVDKITRVISLSGAIGRVRDFDDPILVQWKKYLDTDSARERVKIGDANANIDILRNAHNFVHEKANTIPDWVDIIHVSPWGDNLENLDELVSPLQALDFIATLGRGSLVVDKTQRSNNTGRMVHDMDNLKTETLIDFLHGKLPSNGLNGGRLAIIK